MTSSSEWLIKRRRSEVSRGASEELKPDHELSHPIDGISDWRYAAFVGREPRHIGPPTDVNEATRVEWVSLDRVRQLAASGEIPDGPSLLLLSYYLGIHRPRM